MTVRSGTSFLTWMSTTAEPSAGLNFRLYSMEPPRTKNLMATGRVPSTSTVSVTNEPRGTVMGCVRDGAKKPPSTRKLPPNLVGMGTDDTLVTPQSE